MAKKFPFLSRLGLCHVGQEDCVSVNDGTFVTMAKVLPCLSRIGLCQDGQEAPVSVEDATWS